MWTLSAKLAERRMLFGNDVRRNVNVFSKAVRMENAVPVILTVLKM